MQDRSQLTPEIKAELDALQERLLDAEAIEELNDALISSVKQRIIAINEAYTFPDAFERSQEYRQIRVTRPEGSYGINFRKFIEIYGMDIFVRCFDIKKAELNIDNWNTLIRNEEVTEDDLLKCIIQPRDLQPRVRLMKSGADDDLEED